MLRSVIGIVIAASLCLICRFTAGAAERQEGLDAVLLMDCSGSMKSTDPESRRKPAAQLFISLLGKDDRVGIIGFSTAAETLIGLTAAKEQAGQNGLQAAVEKVSSTGAHTNLHEAVKKGLEVLRDSQKKERVMILMSDGRMDTGKSVEDTALSEDLRTRLLAEVAEAKIKIYTIAFTAESDRQMLEDIAQKTGGAFRSAPSDNDLHIVFSSLFEKLKSPDMLPLSGSSFSVDKEVQELTVLVTREKAGAAVVLTDPVPRRITAKMHDADVTWFESGVFDMVTVRKPAPGTWRISFGAETGNKVFVLTDLKLRSSFNADFIPEGGTVRLDAWVERNGVPMVNRDILDLIRITAHITPPGGKPVELKLERATGEGVRPGSFAADFMPDQPGEYAISLLAGTETFRREKTFRCTVTPKTPQQGAAHPTPQHAAPPQEHISWGLVMAKFAGINLLVALLSAIGFYGKKYVIKFRRAAK